MVSPDEGGIDNVQKVAKKLNMEWTYIAKSRKSNGLSFDQNSLAAVNRKTIFILDDIVDTAKTASGASKILLARGAKKVFAGFSHGIFSSGTLGLLKNSGIEKAWVSNSVIHDKEQINNNYVKTININKIIIEQVLKVAGTLEVDQLEDYGKRV